MWICTFTRNEVSPSFTKPATESHPRILEFLKLFCGRVPSIASSLRNRACSFSFSRSWEGPDTRIQVHKGSFAAGILAWRFHSKLAMDDLGNLDCNRQSGKASESESWSIGEAFRIDDLLDFSNEDIGGPIGGDEAFSDSSVTEVEACSDSPERKCSRGIRTPNVVEADGHLRSEELYLPNDALEELEWLSNFIDDSDVCTDDAQEFAPASDHRSELAVEENQCKPSCASVGLENRTSCVLGSRKAVPGRARSKRTRGTSTHFSPFSNTGFETRSTVFVNVVLVENRSSEAEASVYSGPAKKATKGSQIKKTQDGSQARRCSHCLSQKTPQWRTGPLGPKTLCNACGVRFKSGRLLPEYRPALSPTFLSEIHSNCHRKVVEIRRQKERQQREQKPSLMAETSSVDGSAEAAEGESGRLPMQ